MRRISPTAFRVARRGTSREVNRQIALNLIRAQQPLSRSDLARLMRVRPGGVSLIVNDLLRAGLVFEGAKGPSRLGRRPRHLYVETRKLCAVAADVSASRTAILVTDLLGRPLIDVLEFPTRPRPRVLIAQLGRSVVRVLKQHPEFGRCVGLGVAVSGVVDQEGRLRFSPTLGWRDVDLVTPLRAATGLPVVVENSVKACILAQVWAVTGDEAVDGPVAFVNVSDGVGVGIAVDGKLLRGANSVAGEFGHVPLDIHGPVCSCGQRGCWESYVSKRAVTARYLGRDPSWTGTSQPEGPTVGEVVARARSGEARALETLRVTADYLGRGFAIIGESIDPKRIYVGGELTTAWDLIAGPVRQAMPVA